MPPEDKSRSPRETHREEQYTTYSTLKEGPSGNETLTFTLDFLVLRLVCICVIPPEGYRQAPVYVKFRLRGPKDLIRGGYEEAVRG
jgi:hypothetical protein